MVDWHCFSNIDEYDDDVEEEVDYVVDIPEIPEVIPEILEEWSCIISVELHVLHEDLVHDKYQTEARKCPV